MCIILDANAAHDLTNQTPDGKPVLDWLLDKNSKSGMIIGGKLTHELGGISGMRDILQILKSAARLHEVDNEALAREENAVKALNGHKSNDLHVLALARASRSALIFTKDKPLHKDLKNKNLVKQKISIYQTVKHVKLLKVCVCGAP
jgi:hypothetical protein